MSNNPNVQLLIPNLQNLQYAIPSITPSSFENKKNEEEILHKHIVYLVNVKSRWNIGLCDCCIRTSTCIKGTFCPCYLFATIADKMDGSGVCCNCLKYTFCASCVSPGFRRKIRVKYNLPAAPCNDFCTTFFCGPCALCQEYEELEADHKLNSPNGPKQNIMI